MQHGNRLIGEEDQDASTVLGRAFADEGIDVLTQAEVQSVSWSNQRPSVEVVGPHIGHRRLDGSHVLVAAGRRPNTDTLNLSAAGVKSDEAGFVLVDECLSTSAPGIWAVGDVNGQQPFTRVCQEEAKVAYANAFEGAGLRMQQLALPRVRRRVRDSGFLGRAHEIRARNVTQSAS